MARSTHPMSRPAARSLGRIMNAAALVGTLAAVSLTAAWAAGDDRAAPDADLKARFAQADANQDGKLSKDEAAAWPELAARFESYDTDHDSGLSYAEFVKAMQPMK